MNIIQELKNNEFINSIDNIMKNIDFRYNTKINMSSIIDTLKKKYGIFFFNIMNEKIGKTVIVKDTINMYIFHYDISTKTLTLKGVRKHVIS